MAKEQEQEELVNFFDMIEEVEENEQPDNPSELDTEEEETKDEDKGEETTEDDTTSSDEGEGEGSEDDGEPEEEEEEEVEESVVDGIKKMFGYEIEGEFEDNEEGIAHLTREVATRMAEEYIDERFKEHPIMQNFFEYVSEGGDPSTFINTQFPETDYESVEFDEDNVELQERLVKEELVASGYSGEELKAELEDIKNGGILESKARRALSRLKAKQQSEKDSLVEKQREKRQQEEEQQREAWNQVKDTIKKKNELKGMKFPESDKNPFFDFMTKPVKEGKTARDLKLEKLELEDTLAVDYLLFKDFNLADLVERKAKDLNAKSLKERLRQAKLDKRGDTRKTGSADEELGTL